MKYEFLKVRASTPEIKVADTTFNTDKIIDQINLACDSGVEVLTFPELSITGSTCGDLYFSKVLLDGALEGLKRIVDFSLDKNIAVVVGLPLRVDGRIYNVCAVVNNGKVVGVTPKRNPASNDFNRDGRQFAKYTDDFTFISIFNEKVPFGKVIYHNGQVKFAIQIGQDFYFEDSNSVNYALAGAEIIVNPTSYPETVGAKEWITNLVLAKSVSGVLGVVVCGAGAGESTTDCVYGGYKLIVEKGKVLNSSGLFENSSIDSEIDFGFISYERGKTIKSTACMVNRFAFANFTSDSDIASLTRKYEKTPFVPTEVNERKERGDLILEIQAEGLKKRISHTNANTVVLGLSGGLDSTLALLVAVTAIKKLGRPLKDVVAITMPCFGTTSRTFLNTIKLSKALGVTLKKIDIGKAVTRHLKDIKHADGVYDVAFENAQARERTQVLMDVANMYNGLVVGTGDLSEVALGWSTYNGDHMSMYGVNCTVPKTLVRHVVENYASASKGKLRAVLEDILDTPVSPELLPTENDAITQKTEDIVGPYILHDFFLYNMVRKGYSPSKLYYVAKHTFKGDFLDATILKWLKIFTRRFINQQFKRSCVPDGVKVGSVGLSPRGDFAMPSDAVATLWLNDLENL